MNFPGDSDLISHGIQLSVAPVFLLTAVSGLIGAVAGRLARIIDRGRTLENLLRSSQDQALRTAARRELKSLRTRGKLSNLSIAFLTACAMLIGTTIVLLFLGETLDLQGTRIAAYSFLCGVVCFLLAMMTFMAETMLASRALNFGRTAGDSQAESTATRQGD